MTVFLFVRHCETEMNLQPHLVGGRSNHTPPTELGRLQAARFGDYLREANIIPDAIFSSGAIRTDTTATIALERARITIPIIRDERLLEVSQGEFEGMLKSDVYTPETQRRYALNTLEGKLPSGESILDAQRRKRDFLDEKHLQYPDGVVLVFGHGLAIRSLAGQIRDFTKQQILTGDETSNVSLTKITVINQVPTVHFVGKTVITE